MLDFSLIEKATNEKKIHVFKNVFSDTPTWDQLLPILNKYVSKDLIDYPDKSYIKTKNLEEPFLSFDLRCRFWSRLTFQLYDRKDPLENDIAQLVPILQWAKKHYPDRLGNTFALISLMSNRGHVGLKHSDEVDQFQWQCQGTAIWRTGDNLENEDIIEPGDFIFIPKGIQHEIETVYAPRAVINLVINN